MDKLSVFKAELNYIKNPAIKKFTKECLLAIPEYFWTVGASSTGKYHPKFSCGEGGLVNHVKAATRILVDLLSLEMMPYSDLEKDIAISAIILHDCAKHGLEGSEYTVADHPLVVADLIRYTKSLRDLIDEKILDQILLCVITHMGEFCKDYKTKKEVLPKPVTKLQKIVHIADYLSSRKYFAEFDFSVVVPRERNY